MRFELRVGDSAMGPADAVHPTDETLRSYAQRRLDDLSAELVDEHLQVCVACRRRLAEAASEHFLARPRDERPQPNSTGPRVSSLTGLSLFDAKPYSPAQLPRT